MVIIYLTKFISGLQESNPIKIHRDSPIIDLSYPSWLKP